MSYTSFFKEREKGDKGIRVRVRVRVKVLRVRVRARVPFEIVICKGPKSFWKRIPGIKATSLQTNVYTTLSSLVVMVVCPLS